MKHSFQKNPGSTVELEIELTQDEFDPYWQEAHSEALANIELKGFRKGTAPKELAEKAINKEAVFEKAATNAIRSSFNEIIKEKEWTVINQPKIEITSGAGGLKYKSEFTIFPEINLPDYKKISKKILNEAKNKESGLTVADDEVEKSINWLRNSRAQTVAVSRTAAKGDAVDIDLSVSVDGKPVEGQQSQRDQFILGEGRFLRGFEEKIEGSKAGDNLNFSLQTPSDYWKKDLQNKQLDFYVKINNVLERKLPELNDDFVKSLGNFKTVGELRSNLEGGLLIEKQEREKEKARIKILDELVDSVKIDIPQIMVDKTLENMEREKSRYPQPAGLKELARKKVASYLIIHEISKKEGLQPTSGEVEAEVAKHQHNKNSLDSQKFYDYVYEVLQNKKVFEFLENEQNK